MATDIIARGMITEYKSGTNISFTENGDGSVTISASGDVSSKDTVARDAIDKHKSNTSNPHNVTPEQIGLGYVDNTADLDKPISTAVQTALDDKANIEHTHKKSDITDFPDSFPANGGNANTVNNHTVNSDVPADAVFTDTTYDTATKTEDGLMSAADKSKIDGIAKGANKTVVDTALSSTSTNPVQNKVVNSALNNKADKSKYDDTTINVGRKADTTVGGWSAAEGYQTTASNTCTHAEGYQTTASGGYSHAEGYQTTASNGTCHAEGHGTTASGNYGSHAEGHVTTASGDYSHAEGIHTTASNKSSHAGGHFNADMITGGARNNTVGTAFVIGNGTSSTALSNAFSVQFSGVVKAKSTITASTTADYAEFFEWLDENPDNDDRIGYFVTLDGDKIRIAAAADDYILGVVSGEPFVLGNGDCDTWNGMFLRDEFRRTIYEPSPKMVEVDGEFVEVEGEFEGTRPKLNPEYDHTQKYISRFERKEWAPVGMLGVLAVRHDGTAVVNGYVTVNADGIATACENAYRVIKSNTDSVVEIIFR